MPTIPLEDQDGFQVMIYTHDHEPRHGHVWKAGEEIVINLEDGSVSKNYMSSRDTRKAYALVAANRDFLITEWERIGPIP
jgi:hypothetical protein